MGAAAVVTGRVRKISMAGAGAVVGCSTDARVSGACGAGLLACTSSSGVAHRRTPVAIESFWEMPHTWRSNCVRTRVHSRPRPSAVTVLGAFGPLLKLCPGSAMPLSNAEAS